MGVSNFIDDIPIYRIKHQCMQIISPDRQWNIPLDIWLPSLARANRATTDYFARNAKVVRIKKRRKKRPGH